MSMSQSQTGSLRSQLVGTWQTISFTAHLPSDPSDVKYPLGPNAQGLFLYTQEGYMSAQTLEPGQEIFNEPGTVDDMAEVGKRYVAYTGRYYLDEAGDSKGPVLMHHMEVASLPRLIGRTTRRLISIETDEKDGETYLTLTVERPMEVFGETRIVEMKLRKLKENHETKPPVTSS